MVVQSVVEGQSTTALCAIEMDFHKTLWCWTGLSATTHAPPANWVDPQHQQVCPLPTDDPDRHLLFSQPVHPQR
jgi:hypothetical protein